MTSLHITLFGNITVAHEGASAMARPTRKVKALLAYLLLHRERPHARGMIAGLFWGDSPEKHARNALSTALWRLRCVLEPEGVPKGTYLKLNGTREIAFNRASDYWLDVEEFERRVDAALTVPPQALQESQIESLDTALAMYGDDLVPSLDDYWAVVERERLRRLYLAGLAHLMHGQAQRLEHRKALDCGLRILELDPLREQVHRTVMRQYVAIGQPAQAIVQYERCRLALERELDVAPMAETQALLVEIRGSDTASPGLPNGNFLIEFERARQELSLARRGYERAEKRLCQAIRAMESLRTPNAERLIEARIIGTRYDATWLGCVDI